MFVFGFFVAVDCVFVWPVDGDVFGDGALFYVGGCLVVGVTGSAYEPPMRSIGDLAVPG